MDNIKEKNIFSLFTGLITNIFRCINKIKDKYMKVLGLKSGHVSCLYYLFKLGPMTQKELCAVCDENKSAISRKVEYLTNHDYILRTQEEGKYKLPINLSKKGKDIAKFIDDKINEVVSEANAELNDRSREILYSSLEKINNKLKNLIKYEEK